MSRLAVLSDIHFDVHHPQAWALTLKMLPELNLDRIFLLGDIVDFEPFTRFDLPPDRRLLLQQELDCAIREFRKLRKAMPEAVIEFIDGNHERHLNREIFKHPALYGVDKLSIPSLLDLKNFDIQWIKSHPPKKIGKLLFLHGDEIKVGGQYPARNLYLKVSGNVLAGHFHRADLYLHRLADGSVHGSWINPCLRSLNPIWQPFSQWHLGFTVVEFSGGGFFHVEQVIFLKRGHSLWASIGGKTYSSGAGV